MPNYMTVDGGTTNTRVGLVKDGEPIDHIAFSMGTRAHAAEPTAYRAKLCESISALEKKHGDFAAVLVSGMLTSEMGLCPLPHVTAPAGLQKLHDGMRKAHIPDVTDKPIYFIPGVKTVGESFLDADMMRGEETELMGLLTGVEGECLFVLPGSHSKIISVDEQGRIRRFSTMLTGEMATALSGHTVLADAVTLTGGIDGDRLLQGYRYCLEKGINEALFKVRIMKVLFDEDAVSRYSFFLGTVLCGEIERLRTATEALIVVAGQPQLKKALCQLLVTVGGKGVIAVDDHTAATATARGAVKIFEYGESK